MSYSADHGRNAAIYLDVSVGGTAAVGTATLVRIEGKNTWTSDNTRDFVPTTSFGDTTKTNVAGLPNSICDVNGSWDFAGSGSLIKNFVGATLERGFMLFPDITNYAGWYLSGKGFGSQKSGGGVAAAVTLDLHIEGGPTGLSWTNP